MQFLFIKIFTLAYVNAWIICFNITYKYVHQLLYIPMNSLAAGKDAVCIVYIVYAEAMKCENSF